MATINVEWLNQNSQRAYPFQEDMQRRPEINGVLMDAYRLPNNALLDFALATNFEIQPQVYLRSFTLGGNVATISIADVSDNTILAVASVVYGDERQYPVNFTGVGKHDDIRGTVVFGALEDISNALPDGVYQFTPAETLFEARCVRPSVPCVSGLYLTDPINSYESKRLRGDVALIAGNNIRLDFDEENNAIIINADATFAFNQKCSCDTDNREEVLTVNGISSQNVVIEGDGACVNVEVSEGKIKITDTCSKPCCGCAELTYLNQKTNEITTSIGKLDSFSQTLSDKLNEFIRNVLLSDSGTLRYM